MRQFLSFIVVNRHVVLIAGRTLGVWCDDLRPSLGAGLRVARMGWSSMVLACEAFVQVRELTDPVVFLSSLVAIEMVDVDVFGGHLSRLATASVP
jgi:hypothetical protein